MGTENVIFDQQKQLDQILPWILPSERLLAVFDCKGSGTGFVAITNKRLMFYDKAFMKNKKALTTIPFNKLTSISSIDQGGMFWSKSSELVLKAGSEEHEFEFWKPETAQKAYQLILTEILENEPA